MTHNFLHGTKEFIESTTLPEVAEETGLTDFTKSVGESFPIAPTTTAPAVVTSDLARTQLDTDTKDLDSALSFLQPGPQSLIPTADPLATSGGALLAPRSPSAGPAVPGIIDNQVAVDTATQSEADAKVAVDAATQAKATISETGTAEEIATAEKAIIETTKKAELSSQASKMLADGGVAMNEETARQLFGKDFTGVHTTGDGTFIADKSAMDRVGGTAAADAIEDTRSPAQIAAEEGIAQTQRDLDILQAKMDARSGFLIEGIKAEYADLITQQKQFNKAFEGGVFVEGVRSGRERFAHKHQLGILKQAIDDGIGKVAGLQGKKNRLIIEAEQARDDGAFKVLAEKMEGFRDTIKDERKAAQDAFDNIIKQGKAVREAMKNDRDEAKLAFDQAITTIETVGPALAEMAASITDPDELQTFLENTAFNMGIPVDLLQGEIAKIQTETGEAAGKTVLDLIKKYPDAGISSTDSVEVAQEKLQKSPSFLRDVAKEQADLAREAGGGTVQEREIAAVSGFTGAFAPGVQLDGVFILGPDGFAEPKAWRELAAGAPTEGLTRKRFIEEFGHLVNTEDEDVLKEYRLTPSELKSIIVEL